MGEKLRLLAREPLVHFLFAGSLLFAVSIWRGEPADPASRTIVISEEQVNRLAAGWEQMWRRPPNPSEIDLLIRDFIKEEIYYREAIRLGLDADDLVIRRHLRTKMEYLAGAQVENAQPDDATLQRWLDRYPARFVPDAMFSFDQIYLGSGDDRNAADIRKAVSSGARWESQGVDISLPKSLDNAPASEVARQFGEPFAQSLASIAPDDWAGPIDSGFGSHLVRIRAIRTPIKPELADVRQKVENDWRAATLKQREAKAYQALLDGYSIRIAKP